MLTLTNTINWAVPYLQYIPITAGTNFEPALTIGTVVRNMILTAPFQWNFNRNEFLLTGGTALAQGTQDYTFNITDFAYLEKVNLLSADGTYGFELKDVYNTNILGIPALTSPGQAQPNAAAVRYYTPLTSVSMRFMPIPDQAYTGVVTYQKIPLPFTNLILESIAVSSGIAYYLFGTAQSLAANNALANQQIQISGFNTPSNNGTFLCTSSTAAYMILANSNAVPETKVASAINIDWFPIPDSFANIYSDLFLAEAMAYADDARSQQYRQRGVAALLAKSEGLSEMQINAFLAQHMNRGSIQAAVAMLKAQQSVQGRGL